MAGICRSHNQPMRWPSGTSGEKLMTARSRWGIGVSAIVLIVVVAFLGTTRSRNSVQARGTGFDSAVATVVFASPGRVEGASETTQLGANTTVATALSKPVPRACTEFLLRVV